MSTERDFGRQLYPFLYAPATDDPRAQDAVVAQVRASTVQKCRDTAAIRRQLIVEYVDHMVDAAGAMAAAFAAGRKLLAFGNGGSATDAQDAVADCLAPPFPHWRTLPALALTSDVAILTAVANDVGFDNVFRRQVIAFAERGDIALGISTSGNSGNVMAALEEAKGRGLITIGFAGYDGGRMTRERAVVDFCFVARSEHVPRVQEGQATVWHTLLELVQACLTDEGRV